MKEHDNQNGITSEIKKRAISGFKWSIVLTGVSILSNVAYRIFLAWSLTKADFGHLSILMFTMSFSGFFGELGIGQAIVAKQIHDGRLLFTVLIVIVGMAMAISGLICVFAANIAAYFDMEQLGTLLKLLCVVIVGNSFLVFFRAVLSRDIRIKLVSKLEMSKLLTTIVVAVILVAFGGGLKGVIYGNIVGVWLWLIVMGVIVMRCESKILQPCFDLAKLRGVLSFSLVLWAKRCVNDFATKADELIIGKLLSEEILGVYYFGKWMLETPRQWITRSFSQIVLPLFAKAACDPQSLRNIYKKLTFYVAAIAFPLFAFLAVGADLYIPVIFGPKWAASIIVVKVFAFAMIIKVITSNISTSLMYVRGYEKTVLKIEVVMSLLYLVILAWIGRFGLAWVLVTYSSYVVLKNAIHQYWACRCIEMPIGSFVYNLRHPLAVVVLLILLTSSAMYVMLQTVCAELQLVVVLFIGLIVAVAYLLVFEKRRAIEFKDLLLRR